MDTAQRAALKDYFNQPAPEDRSPAALAFESELSKLLPEHYGQWVLYIGSVRHGFFGSQEEALRTAGEQSLTPGTFVVRQVLPRPEDEEPNFGYL